MVSLLWSLKLNPLTLNPKPPNPGTSMTVKKTPNPIDPLWIPLKEPYRSL